MAVSISIHVDGYYGLIKGVPNLLELFDKYNIKATFFVNMGREANIFEILRYRNKNKINLRDKNVVKRYSKMELFNMLFFNRGLGHSNCKILKLIKSKGHEVNPHSWSHLRWSKNFNNMNYKNEIDKMVKYYFKCFNEKPLGFVPPTWKINNKILSYLKKNGFKYVGINFGNEVCKKNGMFFIPLSFNKNIEELQGEGCDEKSILNIYKKELGKNYVNLYFHADYEGIKGIKLFEKVIKIIKNKNIKLYSELI